MNKKRVIEALAVIGFILFFGALILVPVFLTNNTFGQRCIVEHHYDRNSVEWRMCVTRLRAGMPVEQIEREIREHQANRPS